MLEDIACLLKDGSYAALVIAGDVYDRSIPSPQAIDLFGSFLGKVKNLHPSPEVLVIPGNHDSPSRLGFGRELFARLGIRLGVNAEDCDKPIIVEQNGERCAFFLLPFLCPHALSAEDPAGGPPLSLHAQSALAQEASRRMEKARRESRLECGGRSVLVSHLFTQGGVEAGSERVFLGNAELVNPGLFAGFDYVALGHLHRCQNIRDNTWYSGSPLAYSFGEVADKYFLSVELADDGTKVEKIPVKPLHRVTSLSGPFARFNEPAPDDAELLAAGDDYLEIRLTDRGVTENAREKLGKRFPRLLSLRQDEALAGLSSALAARGPSSGRDSQSRQGIASDFSDFLCSLYGQTNREEIELFNALLAEAESGELL